ncbi:MAG: Rieske 2Fe-2S domain-containing protein [Deltaproteobacteria bacterium]|nr:Rieske 2Fe-2S domain-containing protein [Deltaproteobacteria bacterium]
MVRPAHTIRPKPEHEGKSSERRGFLRWILFAAAGGVAASMGVLVKLVVPQKTGGYIPTVKAGDILVYAEGVKKGKPVHLDDLQVGDSALTYPKGKEANYANIIRVIRAQPDAFQPPTRVDWTDRGIVAYSSLCTHLSCTVSWEKRTAITASIMICYCHNGLYDPLRGAKVVGGPPPRPVPQVPIKVDAEGKLIITGGFAGPVGPLL